jgi:transcription initiation factor TFIIIB Brf1 subunit/transcription initiation factor TFIIB
MLVVYDYQCPNCNQVKENVLIDTNEEEEIRCDDCDVVMDKQQPAPSTPTATVPTYPGSQRHKAGYVHKFGNRPATKTQIGPGGSVSVDHPTGSKTNN